MRISDWSSDVCSSDLDNELDLQSSRLSIWHTAWMLDQGSRGNLESSMSKVFVSEAVWRVVDRCVQMLGGQGVTSETIVMRIFKDMRAFRIYDGPSEVHRWSIARKILGGQDRKSTRLNYSHQCAYSMPS